MSDGSGLKPQALGGRFKFGGLDTAAVARAEAALKTRVRSRQRRRQAHAGESREVAG